MVTMNSEMVQSHIHTHLLANIPQGLEAISQELVEAESFVWKAQHLNTLYLLSWLSSVCYMPPPLC